MISLPDLADQFTGGLPKEIEAELTAQKRLLQCFATYTLALHSDIAQERRLASLTALGMTQDEVIGTQFLLNAHDMQLIGQRYPSQGQGCARWSGWLAKATHSE